MAECIEQEYKALIMLRMAIVEGNRNAFFALVDRLGFGLLSMCYDFSDVPSPLCVASARDSRGLIHSFEDVSVLCH